MAAGKMRSQRDCALGVSAGVRLRYASIFSSSSTLPERCPVPGLVAFSVPLAAQLNLLSQQCCDEPGQSRKVHRCAASASKRQFEPIPPPADHHLDRDQASGSISMIRNPRSLSSFDFFDLMGSLSVRLRWFSRPACRPSMVSHHFTSIVTFLSRPENGLCRTSVIGRVSTGDPRSRPTSAPSSIEKRLATVDSSFTFTGG